MAYHYSWRPRQRIVLRLAICGLVGISFSPLHAQRPPPNISQDRDLKEVDLKSWECLNKLEGSAKTPDGQERNRLKNRSATDISNLKLQDLDIAGFIQSVSPFDAVTVHTRRKDLSAAQRQQLDPMEKEIVQVTGYLGVAYCGPPETTNCASVDFHDWHLELFEKPPARPPQPGDPTPIICEITPRTQNAIYADKIRIQELTAFFRRFDLSYESTGHPARKIRVIGYRLWDDEHNGAADVGLTVKRIGANKYHNPWRQTAWEVHPAIKIVALESPMSPSPSVIPEALSPDTAAPSPSISIASPPPTSSASVTATASPTSVPVAPNVSDQRPGSATPATTPPPAPPVKPAVQPQSVTLTAPVTIQIRYGQTTLNRGTRLPVVSRDAETVVVEYMGERYPIPITSTDLQ